MQGTESLLAAAGHGPDREEEATAKRISLEAARLLRFLTEHSDGACTLEELGRDLRMSRAASSRALRELEAAGLVSLHVEDG